MAARGYRLIGPAAGPAPGTRLPASSRGGGKLICHPTRAGTSKRQLNVDDSPRADLVGPPAGGQLFIVGVFCLYLILCTRWNRVAARLRKPALVADEVPQK